VSLTELKLRSTTAFYWFLVSFQVAEILGTLSAGLLLSVNIWLPALTGLLVAFCCIVVVRLLPETKPVLRAYESDVAGFSSHLVTCLQDNAMLLALLVFSLSEGRGIIVEIVLQFATKHFHYSIPQVSGTQTDSTINSNHMIIR
jgi:hypothetical protein